MSSSDYTSLRRVMQINSNCSNGKPKYFDVPVNINCNQEVGPTGPPGSIGLNGPTGVAGPALFTFFPITNNVNSITYPTGNSIKKITDTVGPDMLLSKESYNQALLSFSVGDNIMLQSVGITFDNGLTMYYGFNIDQYSKLYVKDNATQSVFYDPILTSDVFAIDILSDYVYFYKNGTLLKKVTRVDNQANFKGFFGLDSINFSTTSLWRPARGGSTMTVIPFLIKSSASSERAFKTSTFFKFAELIFAIPIDSSSLSIKISFLSPATLKPILPTPE